MDIQIHSSIEWFLETFPIKKTLWEETIESHFKPLQKIIPMSFKDMGAAIPEDQSMAIQEIARRLHEADIPNRVLEALTYAYDQLKSHGCLTFPKTLHVAVLVSNGQNKMHNELNHGFTGFGGIPGFIILILSPTDYILQRLEAHVAHEFHHNVRFMIEPWPIDRNISVGRFLLDEGMAESFGAALYGEENIGDQTTSLQGDHLIMVREIIEPHIHEVGFATAQTYLYGDSIAEIYSLPKTGIPHGGGYAVGYHWAKEYLRKTHSDIFSMTAVPSKEILAKLFSLD